VTSLIEGCFELFEPIKMQDKLFLFVRIGECEVDALLGFLICEGHGFQVAHFLFLLSLNLQVIHHQFFIHTIAVTFLPENQLIVDSDGHHKAKDLLHNRVLSLGDLKLDVGSLVVSLLAQGMVRTETQ
jgi:hypothetical protein